LGCLPGGARADTDNGDGIAGQANEDINALKDNAQKPEESGGSGVAGIRNGVAALNRAVKGA
jgi:hypothetical protein